MYSSQAFGDGGEEGGEVSVTAGSVARHFGAVVKGTSVDVGEVGERVGRFCDWGMVRKVYNLGGGGQKKGKSEVNGTAEGKDEVKEMESVILGIIALKGS